MPTVENNPSLPKCIMAKTKVLALSVLSLVLMVVGAAGLMAQPTRLPVTDQPGYTHISSDCIIPADCPGSCWTTGRVVCVVYQPAY